MGEGSAPLLGGRTSLVEVHTDPTSSSCLCLLVPRYEGTVPLLAGTPPSPACHNELEIRTYKHEWIFLPLSPSARRQQRLKGTQEVRLPYLTTLVRWTSNNLWHQHPEWPETTLSECPWGKVPDWVYWGRKHALKCGHRHPMGWVQAWMKRHEPSTKPSALCFLTADAIWPARNRKQTKNTDF